jgi:F-type H+-transporting ATPase subunit b
VKKKTTRRLSLALGLGAALAAGSALAQQPQQPPPGMPAGHPPLTAPPSQPGQPPGRPAMPMRPLDLQPGGRPIGPGGQRLPPGHGRPGPGGRPGGAHSAAAHESEHAAHGEEHCPGHGPTDPPPHVNWWHGLIGVNNEAAEKGGVNALLWRYHNDKDPCDPKNQPPPFLASVLNFGLLAFILARFGRKPLLEALQKRKQSIMQEIDNASRLKEEAEQRLDDYEEKLERLEETLAELKAEYAAQAVIEQKNVLAEAEERRARMRRDAEFRVEQELKAARAMLLQEAVQNAVAAAEGMLRQRLAKADLDRLADDYLQTIPRALTAGPARGAQTTGAAT